MLGLSSIFLFNFYFYIYFSIQPRPVLTAMVCYILLSFCVYMCINISFDTHWWIKDEWEISFVFLLLQLTETFFHLQLLDAWVGGHTRHHLNHATCTNKKVITKHVNIFFPESCWYILNWVLSNCYVRVTPDKSTKHFNIASFDILTLSLKH